MKYLYTLVLLISVSSALAAGLANIFNDLNKKPVTTTPPQAPKPSAPPQAPKPPVKK